MYHISPWYYLAPFLLGCAVYFWKLHTRNSQTCLQLQAQRDELLQLNQKLHSEIDERRRAQDAVEEAHNLVLAASRLKAQFLANTSHEVRTPLNAIVGSLCLLQATRLNPEQAELVATLRESSEVLLSLINDVLDFSRIASGKLNLQNVDFPVVETVETAGELVSRAARRKGLSLHVEIDPRIPDRLRGDPTRLRQVLINLLSNAVKFTDHGEVLLRVTVLADDGEKTTLHFEVSDTGVGVDAALGERLFDAFRQGDGSSTRRYGGTGLGLAICRELVDLMHGQIGFESKPGAGSTFWVTVPLEKRSTGFSGPLAPSPLLAGVKILLVDSQPTRSTIFRRYAEFAGASVTGTAGWEDAVTRLRAAREASEPFGLLALAAGPDGRLPIEDWDALTTSGLLEGLGLLTIDAGANHDLRTYPETFAVASPLRRTELISVLQAAMVIPRVATLGPEPSRATPEAAPRVPRSYAHVLLAEDNLTNQKILTRLLEKIGCRVVLATTGTEAVDLAARESLDAIIMDCQMPQMDGFEATARIRRLDSPSAGVPIVALTANATAEDRRLCLEAGMNDFLGKPVHLEALQAALSRWVPAIEQRHLSENTPAHVVVPETARRSSVFSD